MGQGYQIDVFNNTSRALAVSPGPSQNLAANSLSTNTLAPGQWLSSFNGNTPHYVELQSGHVTGFVTIAVSAGSVSSSGSFRVEFDTDSLQNFPGAVLFASAGDLNPVPVSNGSSIGWIYATLYLTVFGKWTEGVVVLFETTGATNTIKPPYQ